MTTKMTLKSKINLNLKTNIKTRYKSKQGGDKSGSKLRINYRKIWRVMNKLLKIAWQGRQDQLYSLNKMITTNNFDLKEEVE